MTGILIDDNGQILFDGQDFAIGEITVQTAQSILKANPGEFKMSPVLGAGIAKTPKTPKNRLQEIKNLIKSNLKLGLVDYRQVDIDKETGEIIIQLNNDND